MWRIRDRRTFADLRARGRRHRCGPITVTALLVDDGFPPRVAYAIGKSVGSAVVRNRVRRRLRAAMGELAPPCGAYLIAAGPTAASSSYPELKGSLATALTATTT